MPTEAAHIEYAQAALHANLRAEGANRRWVGGVPACDVIDLISDLLLLSKHRGYDPCSVLAKVKRHMEAELGERC